MSKKLIETLADRQRLLASVDIFENSVIASRYLKDGTIQRRLVDAVQLASLFGSTIDKQVHWFRLEPAVVAVGTDKRGRQVYLLTRPAGWTKITFEIGRRQKCIPIRLPNLLAEVAAEQKGDERVFCSVDRVYAYSGKLTDKMPLYTAPLPNVYANGSICMGGVNIKAIAAKVKTAAEFFEEAFIKSTFTDHLLNEPLNKAGDKKWRDIYDAIKKTGGCVPLRYLKKAGQYGDKG